MASEVITITAPRLYGDVLGDLWAPAYPSSSLWQIGGGLRPYAAAERMQADPLRDLGGPVTGGARPAKPKLTVIRGGRQASEDAPKGESMERLGAAIVSAIAAAAGSIEEILVSAKRDGQLQLWGDDQSTLDQVLGLDPSIGQLRAWDPLLYTPFWREFDQVVGRTSTALTRGLGGATWDPVRGFEWEPRPPPIRIVDRDGMADIQAFPLEGGMWVELTPWSAATTVPRGTPRSTEPLREKQDPRPWPRRLHSRRLRSRQARELDFLEELGWEFLERIAEEILRSTRLDVYPEGMPWLGTMPEIRFALGVRPGNRAYVEVKAQRDVRPSARARLESKRGKDQKHKAMLLYLAALKVINKTWGKVSELLDFTGALLEASYWKGSGKQIQRWDEWVRAFRARELDFRQNEFMIELVRQEAMDYLIGKSGSAEAEAMRKLFGKSHPLMNAFGNPSTMTNRAYRRALDSFPL